MGKSIEVSNLAGCDVGQRISYEYDGRKCITGRITSVTHLVDMTIIGYIDNREIKSVAIDKPNRKWIRVLYGKERK